jgi:hypothetical protein
MRKRFASPERGRTGERTAVRPTLHRRQPKRSSEMDSGFPFFRADAGLHALNMAATGVIATSPFFSTKFPARACYEMT